MRGILSLVLIFNIVFCLAVVFLFVFVIYSASLTKFSSIKGLEYNEALASGKHQVANKIFKAHLQNAQLTRPGQMRCNHVKDDIYWDPYVNLNGIKYPITVPSFLNESINFDCLNQYGVNIIKRILLWNDYDEYHRYGFGVKQPFITGRCPVVNCEITNDRSRLAWMDMVVIRPSENLGLGQMPASRSSSVRWLLYNDRPLWNRSLPSPDFLDLFNATVDYSPLRSTYAPIYYANSLFTWKKTKDKSSRSKTIKSGMASAFFSECQSTSRRMEYIEELKKFMHVTIFGPCSSGQQVHPSCASQQNAAEPDSVIQSNQLFKRCSKFIIKPYKFFFAFETDICQDYVTDLFYQTLQYDTIPVVFDHQQTYEKLVPKSAFINALDFQFPKDLAIHLARLAADPAAFNAYFEWKRHLQFHNNQYGTFCDICIRLHLEAFDGPGATYAKKKITNDNTCLLPKVHDTKVFDFS